MIEIQLTFKWEILVSNYFLAVGWLIGSVGYVCKCTLCEPDSKEAKKRQAWNVRKTNEVVNQVESRFVITEFNKSHRVCLPEFMQ